METHLESCVVLHKTTKTLGFIFHELERWFKDWLGFLGCYRITDGEDHRGLYILVYTTLSQTRNSLIHIHNSRNSKNQNQTGTRG